MMPHPLRSLPMTTFAIIASIIGLASMKSHALEREAVIAVILEKLNFSETPGVDAISSLRPLAEKAGIGIAIESTAMQLGTNKISLDASGMTLDATLNFITKASGLEWTIRDGRIVVYTEPDIRARFGERSSNSTRQRLAAGKISEAVFENLTIEQAFAKVRELAMTEHGIAAMPKIDVSALPVDKGPRVSVTVRDTNIAALLDVVAALAPTHDWEIGASKINIVDLRAQWAYEAALRDWERNRHRQPKTNPNVDAFAAGPSAPSPPRPPERASDIDPSELNTESYNHFGDNPFFSPLDDPLSTFAADVDTASYSNIRRLINDGDRVPPDAARIEEIVNYFPYTYPPPAPDSHAPFAVHTEIAPAPWAPEHRLVRFGIKGREVEESTRPPINLVFLLDVSGSMKSDDKLPLVVASMRKLTKGLLKHDKVAIAVYAGAAGLVLPSTSGNHGGVIRDALNQLSAGGSTNGGEGIHLAYKTAIDGFVEGGINRVVLCTDGDFNVGTTDTGGLVELVEKKAKEGVFLTVAGFGSGNLNDTLMESISNRGNGNYFYIDRKREAEKVFVNELTGTLVTIAKDVKLQVEFNPAKVGAYRLIGYENRLLEAQDFDDDTKDGGEIGSGHTVTALYEIIPAGQEGDWLKRVSPLKYQTPREAAATDDKAGEELLTLKLRYKEPDGDTSTLIEVPVTDAGGGLDQSTEDFRFATALAGFGMILRDSEFRGKADWKLIQDLAGNAIGEDPGGYRAGFLKLLKTAAR